MPALAATPLKAPPGGARTGTRRSEHPESRRSRCAAPPSPGPGRAPSKRPRLTRTNAAPGRAPGRRRRSRGGRCRQPVSASAGAGEPLGHRAGPAAARPQRARRWAARPEAAR